MVQENFGLSDDDFFTNPNRNEDNVMDALSSEDVIGAVIAAPKKINIAKRNSVPVLIAYRNSFENIRNVPFDKHDVLVGVDLGRNLSYANLITELPADVVPVEDDDLPAGMDSAPPPSMGTSSQLYVEDALEILGFTPLVGKYQFAVFEMNRISNSVQVEIYKDDGAYQDKEVDKFIDRNKIRVRDYHINDLIRLPALSGPVDINIPEKDGIHLEVERVSTVDQKKPLILKGAFNLGAVPLEIVKTESTITYREELKKRPTAVVGISLLILGSLDGFVSFYPMQVPSYDSVNLDGEVNQVTGTFSLDLFQIPGMPRKAQTYFIYPISGKGFFEATIAALVDEDSIK